MRRDSLPVQCLSAIALVTIAVQIVASPHDILLGVMTNVPPLSEQRPQLNLARTIGFDAVRAEFPWSRVETTKRTYKIPDAWDQFVNEARHQGLEPLVILDYGNKFYDHGEKPRAARAVLAFVRYAEVIVRHFAGRVRYFEIWNDWDVDRFPPGDAPDYAKLFTAVYPAVKRIDPSATFLASASSGGDNQWYTLIARLGVAAQADGVAVHPYVYPREANTGSSVGSDESEQSAQQVIEIENTLSRVSEKAEIPLYITEIGWPTNLGRLGLTQEGAALQAERALLIYSALPYVKGVWWYDLRDNCFKSSDYRRCFGAADFDLSLKPTGLAIRSVSRIVKRRSFALSTTSDLKAGLVVLRGGTKSAPQVLIWYAPPGTTSSQTSTLRGYTVSCSLQLNVERSHGPLRSPNLDVTALPMMITYQNGKCARERLLATPVDERTITDREPGSPDPA